MQPTPLFGQVKHTAAARAHIDGVDGWGLVAGTRRAVRRPVVGPMLAHALRGAAERLDPNTPIRAVGQPRQGAGP